MKIGIIGIGMVGGATKELLSPFHEIFSYDTELIDIIVGGNKG